MIIVVVESGCVMLVMCGVMWMCGWCYNVWLVGSGLGLVMLSMVLLSCLLLSVVSRLLFISCGLWLMCISVVFCGNCVNSVVFSMLCVVLVNGIR